MTFYFSITTASSTAGAAMKLVIALFATAMLGIAATVGLAVWAGHIGSHDASLRAVHYDTQYDLSAQRRVPAE
jgi:hypothetical protein